MSTEKLKPLVEFALPDERNHYFVIINGKGEGKPLSLEHLHEQVSAVALNENVPEKIRSHFSQAQNLAVYSWFHYPFNVTAQFLGFVTVEMALKEKTGSRAPFKRLIARAVQEGWIKDEGFTVAKNRSGDGSYVETLIEVMPNLRNRLAHGSNLLHNACISSLLTCSEFINQLYENE